MNSGCLLFKPKFALHFIQIFSTIIEVNQCLKQGCTNPRRQVARTTKFWYGGTYCWWVLSMELVYVIVLSLYSRMEPVTYCV
jgi:hypothetical protein